jgi:signal transduction histidine kinase
VWFTAERQADQILVQVRDRGCGIPPDKLDHIFERFHQVDASISRYHEGSGLGLAMCRGIVQQHAGTIWAESVLGEGSLFSLTLPIVQPENPDG